VGWWPSKFVSDGGRGRRSNVQLTTVGSYQLTLGALIAFLVLVATVVFLIVGVPNPMVPLLLIGLLALARLL